MRTAGPVCLLIAVLIGSLSAIGRDEGREPFESKGYPAVNLKSKHLRAIVYRPDRKNGYYRGPRFDWSSMIAQVRHKRHTYFGSYVKKHRPTIHDHGVGPCEEFGINGAIGFDEAKEGETFIKIGIGHLTKKGEAYRFNVGYPIAKPAPWKTEVTDRGRRIRFEQALKDERGWGYIYTKSITLEADAPRLVISRKLRNTGTRPLSSEHYSHNFFILDEKPIGTGYCIRFPFLPKGKDIEGKALFKGNELRFVSDHLKGSYYSPIEGFAGAKHSPIVLSNTTTGTSIRISSSRQPARVVVWAVQTAVCPETFVPIEVKPGETFAWATTLEFGAKERK